MIICFVENYIWSNNDPILKVQFFMIYNYDEKYSFKLKAVLSLLQLT